MGKGWEWWKWCLVEWTLIRKLYVYTKSKVAFAWHVVEIDKQVDFSLFSLSIHENYDDRVVKKRVVFVFISSKEQRRSVFTKFLSNQRITPFGSLCYPIVCRFVSVLNAWRVPCIKCLKLNTFEIRKAETNDLHVAWFPAENFNV